MVVLVGAADDVFDGPIEELVALSAPRIVRCGAFGHATVIKLFSNMLCAAHDCAVGEALCVAKKHGLDMKLVFDAMRVSSGNSFCISLADILRRADFSTSLLIVCSSCAACPRP